MIEPQMKTPPADVTAEVTDKYTEAYNLNVRIRVSLMAAQENLYEACKGLKEMRDGKKYKELGYQNFEEYCDSEVGIKHSQAYKMITVAEKYSYDSFHTCGKNLGLSKLYLIASLSDEQREEIVQNTNVEEVSVRELKAEIERLKGDTAAKDTEIENQKDLRRQALNRIKEVNAEKRELEKQIEELESKPVEVAVEDNSEELNRLNEEIVSLRRKLEEKPNIQEALPEVSDVEKEITAYLKVAENGLHNLFTAICRQQKFEKRYFGQFVLRMLHKYKNLFEFQEES